MFSEIAIIGGKTHHPSIIGGHLKNVEVISITKDSISHLNSSIPSLPKELSAFRGAQLLSGDLVLSGGCTRSGYEVSEIVCMEEPGQFTSHKIWIKAEVCNNEYHYYKQGSNQWTKVGTMKNVRRNHSSVWMDGCLLTTGGESGEWKIEDSDKSYRWTTSSHHEEFSLIEGVKERKEMSIALKCHTATKFGHHKMIVCGGEGNSVSDSFFKLRK